MLFAFLLIAVVNCTAQKEYNNWYFGNQAGLDFNSNPPLPLTNGQLNTSEGCATISDGNGNLLFYTDGITVWNSNHTVMPNGNGLTGNPSSSQSAQIIKLPGSTTLYYVFTIDVNYCYSIVDMSLNGGLGDVTVKNATIMNNCLSEKQTATRHANGSDIWILMHEMNTDGFNAYILSSTGFNTTPVHTAVGQVHPAPYGQMKFSHDGSRIALGLYSAAFPIELFDFDNATGIVSNSFGIPATYSQCYGVEFSPDNSKLYCTANPGINEIYQFDLNAGSNAAIISSATLVATTLSGFEPTGLQLGPDLNIYICSVGSGYMHIFDEPNLPGTACNYISNYVFLNGSTCQLGLPPMSLFVTSMIVQNTCIGDSTFFSPSNINGVAGIYWDFGDPASGTNNNSYLLTPVHYYTASGTYTVQMINYFLNGSTDTIVSQIQINPLPVSQLGNDTVICTGSTILLTAGSGTGTYLWHDSSTAATYLASGAGNFYVTITENGCKVTDSIIVTTQACSFPAVMFSSSDTSFCEKKCIDFFDLSTNSPTSWQWFFPGADSTSSTEQNPVNICYNSYGSFDVTLIACNAAGCDTLIMPGFIKEFQPPAIPVITIHDDTLFSSPATTYQWYNISGILPGETNQYYVFQQPDYYYVVVTDSNGCAASSSVIFTSIQEAALTDDGLIISPNPNAGTFNIWFSNSHTVITQCRVYDAAGRMVFDSGDDQLEPGYRIDLSGVADGVYQLHLTTRDRSIGRRIVIVR